MYGNQGYGGYPPGQGGGYPPAQGGGYPPAQGGGYPPGQGGYMQPPPANDAQQWFNTVDKDHSGHINWEELKAALINGQGNNFSDTACRLMIGMFDRDKTGTIDINEFQQLFAYINQWLAVFKNYDRDQSGHIEEQELAQALQQMGFKFSPDFIQLLISKADLKDHKQMSVDQFIVVCIQIQKFTEAFRARDQEMKGVISISFEDFLSVAISCST